MGSCVSSLHKNPDSAMKFQFGLRSKNDKIVIPTPVNDKPLEGADAAVKSQWSNTPTVMASRDFGSKEEAFFDSQPWLESDCEDDFFSVNGDFTPSRGNTPVHHSFSAGTPGRGNRSPFLGRNSKFIPESSPADKKKKLSDLFKESASGDDEEDNVKDPKNAVGILKGGSTNSKVQIPPKSTDGTTATTTTTTTTTPFVSGVNSVCSSSEISPPPNAVLKPQGEKSLKSVQCCLPRLLSSRSFSERKKKMSPALTVAGV